MYKRTVYTICHKNFTDEECYRQIPEDMEFDSFYNNVEDAIKNLPDYNWKIKKIEFIISDVL